jgi:hypothetical protein
LISVIVTAQDDPRPLARLLAALVPAAADGLVRHVAVIAADGPSRELADDAGADLHPTFAEALTAARSDWLAGLPLSAVFVTDWMDQVAAHLARDTPTPVRLVTRPAGLSLSPSPEGWLVPRRLLAAGAAEQDVQRLARRGGGGRLRILDRR